MKMVGGTRIIGQDMVCGFSNGKYKTFEGTEINIECVKAKVKDLRVEGKTYQNLFKAELSQGHIGNSSTTYNFRVNSEGISLEEKTYTLYINTNYQLLLYYDYVNTGSSYVSWTDKIVWTNSTKTNNIRIMVKKTDNSEITVDEVIGKIVLLEGDYTNIDIPNSINGIESVSERENNVLSVKINDNTTTLNLPIPLRSLPNGTCDTIEGNKLVQRVGRVVLENIKDYNIADQIKNNNRIGIMVGNVLGSSTRKPIISDHFFDLSNGGESVNGSFSYGGRIFLYLGLSTLEEYVEWFKGNPTTFYYSLSEPIIHDLEIPSVSTTKGTNIITTENNIKPKLSMKVKVKK